MPHKSYYAPTGPQNKGPNQYKSAPPKEAVASHAKYARELLGMELERPYLISSELIPPISNQYTMLDSGLMHSQNTQSSSQESVDLSDGGFTAAD